MSKVNACDCLMGEAKEKCLETAHVRAEAMKPCPIGSAGICCKNCFMGPCRLTSGKDGEEKCGVCGASRDAVAARNFCRMIAAGNSGHVDHARDIVHVFLAVAKGENTDYSIKDENKLRMLAGVYDVDMEGKTVQQIAVGLGEKVMAEFGQQDGKLHMVGRAPRKRQELWDKLGMTPRGVDREVVDMLHHTIIGNDQDPESLLLQGSRCALSNGWGGSMIATELQDVMFGTPFPRRGKMAMGVLEEKQVNVLVHGHDPLLAEMIVVAANDPEMNKLAKAKGAEGINIAGICCTANETLLRHGVPMVGSFSQQELAIVTGAVDVMAVDVQCLMASLPKVASCFHTKIVTTSPKAKIPGAVHMELHEDNALNCAKDIVRLAIENYPKRKTVNIPKETSDVVVGFSHETINYMLGGSFRSSYRPLNDNIMNGRILGVVGIVGCSLPKLEGKGVTATLVKELIANNVLVIHTGCAAYASAREDLLIPEAALKYAGAGLAEVCETVGIPPVLHSGSCVDNSRILIACAAMVAEGGLGNDLSDLPIAGCAPEWMSEKAIAIGQYFVASGALVVFGSESPVKGAPGFDKLLTEGYEKLTGGKWAFSPDPHEMARIIIDHIKAKRKALGLEKAQERVLFDMEMRRKLEV
ncbi:MAG: anaerobic carbon-monoxide dehydrogenase catalytic subunit [Candidatus Schekmanbacteria bacterium]|nr:anaerobic carbon-monoxide dehydrogenase catalytic subunit [Candidatus Schekmanbacteria bacterium]